MSSPLQPGTHVVARGERWLVRARVPYADCEAIHLSASKGASHRARTLLLPFDRVDPLPSPAPLVVRPRRWARGVLLAVSTSRPFGSLACAAAARIDVLPFQFEPALALLRHAHTRVLLADDVGLGKTVQAGLVLCELARAQQGLRAIVLAPAGLREQWRQELRERFDLEATVADTAWLSATVRKLPGDVNPWSLPGIHLVSFDLVKRPEVLRSLEEVAWDVAVVDEAHACTLLTARRAAAHAIAARARRVILLTATPPDGDPPQLAALRAIGEIRGDLPLLEFRRTRSDAEAGGGRRRSTMLHVRLSSAERRVHRLLERYTSLVWTEAGRRADPRARLAALVLRKRALSSPWSLSASLRRRMVLLASPAAQDIAPLQLSLPMGDEDPLDDEAPDDVLGAAGLADSRREREMLDELDRAALRACREESKVRFLLRFLRRAREPALVFTEYRDTLQHLERCLSAAGWSSLTLHGGMTAGERTEVQRAFNEGAGILLATDAASEGLNLHHRCRTVVHFELPWTLSRLRQRTGRVDRLGQRRPVHEILLVARHTAERLVLAPLVRRAQQSRATGTPDRLVEALTETAVGESVMEPRAVPPTCPPVPQAGPPARLREEAVAEATRIRFERAVARQCGTPTDDHGPLLRRSRARERFTLVVAVRLEDDAGRVAHSSVVALEVRVRLQRTVAGNADWRQLGATLADRWKHTWLATALGGTQAEVDAAADRHRAMLDVLAARDAVILETRTAAARQLVQAGLFDRRALHGLERRQETTARLREEAASRTADASSTLRRVAVVLGLR